MGLDGAATPQTLSLNNSPSTLRLSGASLPGFFVIRLCFQVLDGGSAAHAGLARPGRLRPDQARDV